MIKANPASPAPAMTPTWGEPYYEGFCESFAPSIAGTVRGAIWSFGWAVPTDSNTSVADDTIDTIGESGYGRYGRRCRSFRYRYAGPFALTLAGCAHDQELSVRYESRITSDRDAVVCRYYERRLTQLYAEQARATESEQRAALKSEVDARSASLSSAV